jgi:mRNA interferase MazF
MEIKKWHVYLADLNPRRGTEPGKTKPVVVVQTDLLNSTHPSTIICPITTNVQPKAQFLRVHLAKGEGGLVEKSDVMVDQLRAIDNRRFIQHLGVLSHRSQQKLTENIHIVLN